MKRLLKSGVVVTARLSIYYSVHSGYHMKAETFMNQRRLPLSLSKVKEGNDVSETHAIHRRSAIVDGLHGFLCNHCNDCNSSNLFCEESQNPPIIIPLKASMPYNQLRSSASKCGRTADRTADRWPGAGNLRARLCPWSGGKALLANSVGIARLEPMESHILTQVV